MKPPEFFKIKIFQNQENFLKRNKKSVLFLLLRYSVFKLQRLKILSSYYAFECALLQFYRVVGPIQTMLVIYIFK